MSGRRCKNYVQYVLLSLWIVAYSDIGKDSIVNNTKEVKVTGLHFAAWSGPLDGGSPPLSYTETWPFSNPEVMDSARLRWPLSPSHYHGSTSSCCGDRSMLSFLAFYIGVGDTCIRYFTDSHYLQCWGILLSHFHPTPYSLNNTRKAIRKRFKYGNTGIWFPSLGFNGS